MLTEVANQLNEIPEPVVDEAVIKAANGLSTKLVLATLAQKISNESNGVRSLSIQVTSENIGEFIFKMGVLVIRIATFDKIEEEKENSSNFNQLILQLTVQVKSLLECVQRLINDVETLKTIQVFSQVSPMLILLRDLKREQI